MIIKVKNTPTNEELMTILRQKFPGEYSVKEFGLGKKSVMIKQSTFIGVQVTVRENEILVDSAAPTLAGSFLSSLFMVDLGSLIRYLFGAAPAQFHKFEHEIASLINQQYN